MSVNLIPEELWGTDGTSGFLAPALLMHDPHQPRLVIGGEEWPLFVESIKEAGVRETIHVTPLSCATWVTPQDTAVKFVIVSGHRRHLAATEAGLAYVPVVIKIYANEQSHREDSDLLNVGRKDLTPYEEALEIKRRRELGETWEVISRKRGASPVFCQLRIKLLNLAPDIRDLINPVARSGKRSDFPINVAQALGSITGVTPENFLVMVARYGFTRSDIELHEEDDRLSFALQRTLLAHIQSAKLSAAEGVEFITNGKAGVRHNSRGRMDRRGVFGTQKKLRTGVSAVYRGPLTSLTNTVVRSA